MKLSPGERRTCSCGAAFIGARVLNDARRPGGARATDAVMPITLAPNAEKGNVLLQQIEGELRAIVFGDPAMTQSLRERGVQLRLSHFADCPDAERYRRRDA